MCAAEPATGESIVPDDLAVPPRALALAMPSGAPMYRCPDGHQHAARWVPNWPLRASASMPPRAPIFRPPGHRYFGPPGTDKTALESSENHLPSRTQVLSAYGARRVGAPFCLPKPGPHSNRWMRPADARSDASSDRGSRSVRFTLRRTNPPPPKGEDMALVSRNSSLIEPQVKRNPIWSGP